MTNNNAPQDNGTSASPPGRNGGTALEPAPRSVPALLRLYIQMLYSQPAIFLLGIGLSGFIGFGVNSDWKAAAFLLPTATVHGTVTGVHPSSGSLGGSKNGSTGNIAIDAVSYTFAVPGGASYHGRSYFTADAPYQLDTGEEMNEDTPAGTPVTVQYVKEHPALSRIRGMRTGVFEAYSIAALVFPLAGFFILGRGLKAARWTCTLLAQGRQDLTTGNLHPAPGQERPTDPQGGYGVNSFMAGSPRIRAGQLYAPSVFRLLVVCFLPAIMIRLVIAALQGLK